jgi:hypothetical protein
LKEEETSLQGNHIHEESKNFKDFLGSGCPVGVIMNPEMKGTFCGREEIPTGVIFPAPSLEKSAPYDFRRAGPASGPWNRLAHTKLFFAKDKSVTISVPRRV